MAYVVEKAGLHYAVIYEGVNRITGKERRRWHRCSDSADAKALACRLGAQRPRARFAGSSMSLSDYLLGRWLPAQEAALSPTTYARYVSSLTHYLLPHLGHVQLRQLHADQLGRSTAVSPSTPAEPVIRWRPRRSSTCTSSFAPPWSRPSAAAPSRESSGGRAPPGPRKRPSVRRRAASWTASELATFLESSVSSRHWMLFRLAAATGMRRGELLGLRWSDIHLDTGRVEVTQALTAVGYTTSFSRLKTKTSRRCVTLDAETVECFRVWRTEQAKALKAAGRTNELGLVFTGSDGGLLHPHLASQAFTRAHRNLAVKPICLHDLRHTHASLLLRDRVPIKVVSERLGHSNPAFTMATYQHVLPGMQDDAARAFGTILDRKAPSAGR